MNRLPGVDGDAVTSADGRYRYRVTRTWGDRPHLVWVMTHPRTADADLDDRTLRKVQTFTRAWGWGGLVVVNIFAAIVPHSRYLRTHAGPVGSGNDDHIIATVTDKRTRGVIAAWGNEGRLFGRGDYVEGLLRGALTKRQLWRMPGGLTRFDMPPHPLYFHRDSIPVPWRRAPGR